MERLLAGADDDGNGGDGCNPGINFNCMEFGPVFCTVCLQNVFYLLFLDNAGSRDCGRCGPIVVDEIMSINDACYLIILH